MNARDPRTRSSAGQPGSTRAGRGRKCSRARVTPNRWAASLSSAFAVFLLGTLRTQPVLADIKDVFLGGGGALQGGVTTQDASGAGGVPGNLGSLPPEKYTDAVLKWILQWLRMNEVDTSGIKYVVNTSSFSSAWVRPDVTVLATRKFSKGEPILKFPTSVQVRSEWVLEERHPYGEKRKGKEEGEWTGYAALATWLMAQQMAEDKSPWVPLMRSLPPYVPLPIFYSEETLKELQFQPAIDLVKRFRQVIDGEEMKCSKEILGTSDRARQGFLWGMSVALARCFGGPIVSRSSSKAPPCTLLPLVDLLKPKSKFNTAWKFEGDGTFTVLAHEEIKAGDELTLLRSPRSTDTLLLHDGVVLPNNHYDRVLLVSVAEGATQMYETFFGSTADQIARERIKKMTQDAYSAVQAAAEEVKGRFERKEMLVGPKYDVGHAEALAAWHGGVVDPRILASFAAVIHFYSKGQEVGYRGIAKLSVFYGWNLYEGTCFEQAKQLKVSDDEASSLASAVLAVKSYISHILDSLPTSLEADEKELAALEVCRRQAAGKAKETPSDADQRYCKSIGGEKDLTDKPLAIQARLEKKRLLSFLVTRFSETCTDAERQDAGAGRHVVPGNNEDEEEDEEPEAFDD